MKTLVLLFCTTFAAAQSITITSYEISEVPGGQNLHVETVSFNGASYLGYTIIPDGALLRVKLCYSFNQTLPVLTFSHDIPLELTLPGEYQISLEMWNSVDQQQCDYEIMSDSELIVYLDTPENQEEVVFFGPNPASTSITVQPQPLLLEVFDVHGKKVLTNTGQNFDIAQLANGVYLAKLHYARSIAVRKLLIRH